MLLPQQQHHVDLLKQHFMCSFIVYLWPNCTYFHHWTAVIWWFLLYYIIFTLLLIVYELSLCPFFTLKSKCCSKRLGTQHNIDGCCGYILVTCVCMMHLFACWCSSLFLGWTWFCLGLHVCVCLRAKCVCLSFARGAQRGNWGVGYCLEQPSLVLENGAPAPFWCVPLLIHVLPVRWLTLAPFFVWYFRWPKIWWTQNTFNFLKKICVSQCCVFCVCLYVSSCLLVHSQPLVVLLAATTATWLSVRQQCRQLKQCTVLQGLFRAAKALRVLQGHPVRKATWLEI